MPLPDIDWNQCWRQAHANRSAQRHDTSFWDQRAPEFARHANVDDYIGQFITIMQPQRHWTVLDIGSAAGTLAVPLSANVRRITAMDPSAKMRGLLKERCLNQNIDNIDVVDGRWESNWEALGIEMHDVAIASRSLLVDDLEGAILKLQQYARRKVYITTLVDDGPHDRRLIEAVGRPFYGGADYIVVCNLLRRMGIYANVAFTVNRTDKHYIDIDHAVRDLRWMVHDMTAEEEQRLRAYLEASLIRSNGHLRMPNPRIVRWAVLWWEKD